MSINVLIADDHAIVRDGLRAYLESQEDMKVVGDAADGRETLEKLTQLNPDVIILDLAMPNLNGLDTLPQIFQIKPEVNVIILSMHANKEYLTAAFKKGAKGYLIKASAASEVLDAIRSVANGQKYICSKLSDVIVDGYIQNNDQPGNENLINSLSQREREILQLIVAGKTSKEIASTLFIATGTIKTYRNRLMKKLNARSMADLLKIVSSDSLMVNSDNHDFGLL